MLLTTLQCTGRTPRARTVWPQTPTVLGWKNLVCVDTEVPKTHDQRSFQERKMTGRRNSEGMRGRDLRVGRRGGGGDALGRPSGNLDLKPQLFRGEARMEQGRPPTPRDTDIKAATRDRNAHWRTEASQWPPAHAKGCRECRGTGHCRWAGRGAAALGDDWAASSEVT